VNLHKTNFVVCFLTEEEQNKLETFARKAHLAKSFAGWKANDITVAELRSFIARRWEERAANAEINRKLTTLRRGFNLALQAEKILRVPYFPCLEESAPRAGFFELEKFHPAVQHFEYGQHIVNYDKHWRGACQATGLPGKIVRNFRRTAVRNMVRAGIPERVAMQMAGHKTCSVFDRYHIVSDSDLQEAARRLEGALMGQTGTNLGTVARLILTDSPQVLDFLHMAA
jgi:hypothetical protein